MRIESSSASQLAPGRSYRPTEPAKRTSPEKSQPSAAKARWPAVWPGTRKVWNSMPASSSTSSPRSTTSGTCGGIVIARPGGKLVAGTLEQLPLGRRHVHGRAGRLGELGDPADVIHVAVGDEDRRRSAHPPERR